MNEQVKRYDPINSDGTCGTCVEEPDYGAYVEFADYDALQRKACQLNGDAAERELKLRAELEAARGLLRDIAPFFAAPHGRDDLHHRLDAFLTDTPAPEVRQDESLDDRLKQAGMLSVAELLKGAPLDAFIKHAGVHDLATLLQWAEMRRGECLRMMARYDLGEKDKGDDLYEWTVAHCAVFTELHVNLRAALVEQGERQEAFAYGSSKPGVQPILAATWNALPEQQWAYPLPLYTTPQPGPDVRGLVEALEQIQRWDGFPPTGKTWEGSGEPVSFSVCYGSNGERDFMRNVAAQALAAHRQAQRKGESHDT